jgi:hypothetical protein
MVEKFSAIPIREFGIGTGSTAACFPSWHPQVNAVQSLDLGLKFSNRYLQRWRTPR